VKFRQNRRKRERLRRIRGEIQTEQKEKGKAAQDKGQRSDRAEGKGKGYA
jgi:hypothetical protein